MADIWDDDFDDEPATESDLVRQLRTVIKEGRKKNLEYETELNTLRPTVRKTQLADTLKSLGVTNPKIAGLVPKDVEPTEEAVKAWVDEYGDVFNIKTSETMNTTSGEQSTEETSDTGGVPPEQAEQWQRIQSQTSQAGASTPDAESAQLAMLQAAAKAANGNSDKYFAYLTGELALPTS